MRIEMLTAALFFSLTALADDEEAMKLRDELLAGFVQPHQSTSEERAKIGLPPESPTIEPLMVVGDEVYTISGERVKPNKEIKVGPPRALLEAGAPVGGWDEKSLKYKKQIEEHEKNPKPKTFQGYSPEEKRMMAEFYEEQKVREEITNTKQKALGRYLQDTDKEEVEVEVKNWKIMKAKEKEGREKLVP